MTTTSLASTQDSRLRWLARAPRLLLQSVHDPGYTSLRRGLRAGLVLPLALGTATLLGLEPSVTTFLVFGLMALLALADFGGATRSRVTAYVGAALAGIPLIAIGTLASATVWTAVAASAVVGFMLAAMGVLGGYFLSAQTALMLAFVLAVSSAAGVDVLPARMIGWSAAGMLAVLAGWLLWPRSSHVALRGTAASVVRAVAATVAAQLDGESGETARLESKARTELATLQRGFVVAQRRPSGATRRDRALAELATELDRALTFALEAAETESRAAEAETAVLRATVVRALEAAAALLEGGDETQEIEQLQVARDAHRSALDRWAAEQLADGASPESVLDALIAAHPLRLMSMVALAIGRNAEVVAGSATILAALEDNSRGIWNTFREELNPSSIWLRNSLRTALGVALAVFVARSLTVAYAFWVVLGTISALRSNASATGRTALQAMAGTAVGVLIAVPFVGVAGGQRWVLWIALPILVFLAAYTPAAVHFVVGQIAFSVLVVVLFNILAPTDWQIGLVRIEDAALGVAVSAAVGILMWPRGARGQLREALASLYTAGARSLAVTFRQMLTDTSEPGEPASLARDLARTEVIRAQEVFELFLNERGRQVPAIEVWATLLSSGKGFLLVEDILDWSVQHGYAAKGTGQPADTVGSLATDAITDILRLAEEIRTGNSLRVTSRRDASAELRSASLAGLSGPRVATTPEALRSAIGLVTSAVWLAQLNTLLRDLEQPVAETRAAAGSAWWR
jgi:uncharacterized membrane protein YccC